MAKKKRSKVGLSGNRIDWDSVLNFCCIRLARERYHGRVIARATGLTVGQVYNRLHQCGVRLRYERDGLGEHNKIIIKRFSVRTISKANEALLRSTIKTPEIKAKKQAS